MSTATDIAELDTVQRDGLTVTILETPDLGDRSYVVDDGASRSGRRPAARHRPGRGRAAAERGVRLAAVAETHIHNDYVTGGLELARDHGVDVPGAVRGRGRLRAHAGLRTGRPRRRRHDGAHPGHARAHPAPRQPSPSATRRAAPSVVFTGGSLLFGAVGPHRPGRPGAHRAADPRAVRLGPAAGRRAARRRRGAAHPRVRQLLLRHADHRRRRRRSSEQRATTRRSTQDEDDFVGELLAGLDAYPAYYAHMGPVNRRRARAARPVTPPAEADPAELRRRHRRRRVGRRPAQPHRLRRAGTCRARFNFELAAATSPTYLGWLLPVGHAR